MGQSPLFTTASEEARTLADFEVKHSTHTCIVPARQEEVPLFHKPPKSKTNERVFTKDQSVFRPWREDTDYLLEQAFRIDSQNWKLPRFIKDPEDVAGCERVLRENFARLKKIFLCEAADSGFPCIQWNAFTSFCNQCDVVDGVAVNMATVDRAFIATNVEATKLEENPPQALQRFEFLEVMARLAQAKYVTKENGVPVYKAI